MSCSARSISCLALGIENTGPTGITEAGAGKFHRLLEVNVECRSQRVASRRGLFTTSDGASVINAPPPPRRKREVSRVFPVRSLSKAAVVC